MNSLVWSFFKGISFSTSLCLITFEVQSKSIQKNLQIDTPFDRVFSENPKKCPLEHVTPLALTVLLWPILWLVLQLPGSLVSLKVKVTSYLLDPQLFKKKVNCFFLSQKIQIRFLLPQKNVRCKDLNLMIKTYFNFLLQVCFHLMIR